MVTSLMTISIMGQLFDVSKTALHDDAVGQTERKRKS